MHSKGVRIDPSNSDKTMLAITILSKKILGHDFGVEIISRLKPISNHELIITGKERLYQEHKQYDQLL